MPSAVRIDCNIRPLAPKILLVQTVRLPWNRHELWKSKRQLKFTNLPSQIVNRPRKISCKLHASFLSSSTIFASWLSFLELVAVDECWKFRYLLPPVLLRLHLPLSMLYSDSTGEVLPRNRNTWLLACNSSALKSVNLAISTYACDFHVETNFHGMTTCDFLTDQIPKPIFDFLLTFLCLLGWSSRLHQCLSKCAKLAQLPPNFTHG